MNNIKEWNNEPPLLSGVYQVLYIDHCGERECLPDGTKCYSYYDGVDSWSTRSFTDNPYELYYESKMFLDSNYKWKDISTANARIRTIH